MLSSGLNFFSDIDANAIDEILLYFEEISIPANSILFEEDSPSDSLYILKSGTLMGIIHIPNKSDKVVLIINEGELFGELGLISSSPRSITVKALEDSTALKLTKRNFEILINAHPELLRKIKSYSIKTFLSIINSQQHFTQDEINLIAINSEQIDLAKDEILFSQGQECPGVLFIVSGKLVSEHRSPTSITTHEIIKRGRILGLDELITGATSYGTVMALRSSTLIKINKKTFNDLISQHPDLFLKISTLHLKYLHTRTMSQHDPTMAAGTTIVLMPMNENAQALLNAFCDKLQSILPKECTLVNIKNMEEKFGKNALKSTLLNHLDNLELVHKFVICQGNINASNWNEILLDHTEKIVFITGEANNGIEISNLSRTILTDPTQSFLKKELAIIYIDSDSTPQNTISWLEQYNFSLHHHIRLPVIEDTKCFLRFLTGRAIGLVLGGAVSRGWLYTGTLKALYDSGIPIDIFGGTSAGALANASAVMNNMDNDSIFSNGSHVFGGFTKDLSFRGYTYPRISFTSGKHVTQYLKEVCGDMQIENLSRKFFCISCNVYKATQVIHTTGSLWKALRASSSIPGLMPPICSPQGEILADGGIVNNLPVDVMRKFLDNQGLVLTVDMTYEKNSKFNFPPSISNYDLLKNKLNIGEDKYLFPKFIDFCIHAMFAGASIREKENLNMADLIFTPNKLTSIYDEFDTYSQDEDRIKKLLELGYSSAIEKINSWKSDNPDYRKKWIL